MGKVVGGMVMTETNAKPPEITSIIGVIALSATWASARHRVRIGFNSLGQPSKSLGDGLLRVILPYPFLQRRRKWQRFADFESEGLNKSERSLRNLGGLYLERSVTHTLVEPSEAHGAGIDPKIHECTLVERHTQRNVPRRLGEDREIPKLRWQPRDGVVGIGNKHGTISAAGQAPRE